MDKLITLMTLLVLSTSTFALDCAKIKGRLYPVDEQAKALASALKVKTCSAPSFKAAAAKYNVEINTVDASVDMIQAYDAAAKERQEARIGKSAVSKIFETTKKPAKK